MFSQQLNKIVYDTFFWTYKDAFVYQFLLESPVLTTFASSLPYESIVKENKK